MAITGFNSEDVRGKPYSELINSEPHEYKAIWDTLRRRKFWRDEILHRVKRGGTYRERALISPLHDENDKIIHYIKVGEDVTEQYELLLKKQEAEAASQAKSEFLSRMSHELRTPMTSILGFAQLLDMGAAGVLNREQAQNVAQILRAGGHLLELIDEVLDLARIESGRLTLSVTPVEIAPLLMEGVTIIEPQATPRNIKIINLVSPTDNYIVSADRMRLKQIVLNLMSNAVKYNRDGGSVILQAEETPNGGVQIAVQDTGNGIPSHRFDELFESFSRLDAESSDIKGTGIGLTITKRLVEAMNGTIGLESTVGKGSRFFVSFPPAVSR
ncbi:MAG: ATP-binding protein [Candidatus Poribacteria bacterium]|nr:ATP-binding protein [Candidatus Poribacteria bacterium]